MMKENFVFLNVYCTSVADEHKPRGPEGPYQFNDRSVPVYLIKKWDGETLKQQLGFGSGAAATKAVGRALEDALKKNGKVVPPKALRPLLKLRKKADQYLAKERPGYAYKELEKLIALAGNKKKFPRGMPRIGVDADVKLKELRHSFDGELAQAEAEADPATARKALKKMLKTWGMVKALKTELNTRLKNL